MIGFIEDGQRVLSCRGLNITKEVMLDLADEVTGRRELPGFSKNVIFDEEVTCYLHPLHKLVLKGSCEFGKEENLFIALLAPSPFLIRKNSIIVL